MQVIKNWVNAYGSVGAWFGHKIFHILAGGLVGLTAYFSLAVAIVLVLTVAIGKEVHDHYVTSDLEGKSYIPMSYHVLDVIVTCLGGVVGILIGLGVIFHV